MLPPCERGYTEMAEPRWRLRCIAAPRNHLRSRNEKASENAPRRPCCILAQIVRELSVFRLIMISGLDSAAAKIVRATKHLDEINRIIREAVSTTGAYEIIRCEWKRNCQFPHRAAARRGHLGRRNCLPAPYRARPPSVRARQTESRQYHPSA
jgi:hypothetical protein